LLVAAQAHAIPHLGCRAERPIALGCWRANYKDTNHTRSPDGRPPSEFTIICQPRWAALLPEAPPQLPPLPSLDRANPTFGVTSGTG
jgi:hypothetical protein